MNEIYTESLSPLSESAETPRWQSIHVRCDGSLDDLLLQVVSPYMSELKKQEELLDWFFLRYWESGPHLRVRFRPRPGRTPSSIEVQLRNRVREWIVDNPPLYTYDEETYAQLREVFARRERMTASSKLLRPHGDVWAQPYLAESDKYGQGGMLPVFESHFVDSSALALGALSWSPSRTQKWALALGLALVEREVARNLISDSAFEEIMLRWGQTDSLPDLEAPVLQQIIDYSVDAVDSAGGHDQADDLKAIMFSWGSIIHDLVTKLRHQGGWDPSKAISGSDICLHLWCNRLGLSIDEEVKVRGVAASTLQRSPSV